MKTRKTGNQGNRQTVKQTLPRLQARQHTAAMRLKNSERMSRLWVKVIARLSPRFRCYYHVCGQCQLRDLSPIQNAEMFVKHTVARGTHS